MDDHIIVIPRDDTAALMAAIAEIEQKADRDSSTGQRWDEEGCEAVETLSRIASDIAGQAEAQ